MLYQTSAMAMQIARRQACRCRILTEHSGPLRTRGLMDRLEQIGTATVGRASIRAAHAVNLINPAIEPLMRRLAPRTRIVSIANGVDQRQFHPVAAEERDDVRKELGWDARPRVLFVGRAIERKGVALAIEAATAGGGAFELVIAGPGNVTGAHVQFLGEKSRADIAKLYRAADLFLLPSLREGFPITVQEAMASGLPAIVCDATTYERLRARGDTSVTIVPPDATAIAAAINELIASPAEMRRRSSEALSFASREFSWSRATQRHLELYEEVLHRGSPDDAPAR
jgi:glycosyltransferase involved in cell wall biosynthesis